MIDKKAKCIILMQKCCIRFCANGTLPRQEALNNSDDEDGLEEKVSFQTELYFEAFFIIHI